MHHALFPGSFAPWTLGHAHVLRCAREVFGQVTILIASNPAKGEVLPAGTRARIIAHNLLPSLDPATPCVLPWTLAPGLVLDTVPGLVAHYARRAGATHLVRGLRCPGDFAAEMSLHTANTSLEPALTTWAVLCPQDLLYASSTFARAVAGDPDSQRVGTSFFAQTCLTQADPNWGLWFDLLGPALGPWEGDTLGPGHRPLQGLFSRMVFGTGEPGPSAHQVRALSRLVGKGSKHEVWDLLQAVLPLGHPPREGFSRLLQGSSHAPAP